MKKTAMQDLKEDLLLSKIKSRNELNSIENKDIRKRCKKVLSLTLNSIIKRIDEELLEMEKQQIIDASNESYLNSTLIKRAIKNKKVFSIGEQYYNETFNK